jgi:helicase MOV-10
MSLFERLFLREIYSQHPLARHSFGVEQNPTGWSAERVLERKKALLVGLSCPQKRVYHLLTWV